MYLLDTDTIIYNLKGHPAVEKNLRQHFHDSIKISVITLMELYYGAYKSQKVASNLAKIKTIENSMEVIPLGKELVEIFGIHKAKLEKIGTRLDDFDLILACCALTHNLVVVTNNVKHFQRIEGLKIANWTEEPSWPAINKGREKVILAIGFHDHTAFYPLSREQFPVVHISLEPAWLRYRSNKMELVQLVKDVPQRHTAQQNLKMAYEKIKDRKKGIGK